MRFDPTLGSNNLGLKNYRIKNHHIFGIARTSAFIWHIWIPLKKFCKRTRRVCVCIVLVHFGRFSQKVNRKSVKLAVWAVSLNFLHDFTLFVVDIHQIKLISLFRHFSNHFHFHPTYGWFEKLSWQSSTMPSFDFQKEKWYNNSVCIALVSRPSCSPKLATAGHTSNPMCYSTF